MTGLITQMQNRPTQVDQCKAHSMPMHAH